MRQNTFNGFPQLSYIDFGTLKMAEAAFHDRTSLEDVRLPGNMTEVGGWLLSGNPNLRRVYIENGSREVAESLLSYCDALEEVWFSGKESIGNNNLFGDNADGTAPIPSNLTFYVKPGSDAERYAKEHGIRYEHYEPL